MEMGAPSARAPPFWSSLLPAADHHLDRVAPGLDLAGPRALADDQADSPGAGPADATHGAACSADPALRRSEPQSDHPRHVAAHARWRWRRWWWRRWWWWRWWWRRWRWRRRWWRRRRRTAAGDRERVVHLPGVQIALVHVRAGHEGHFPGHVSGPGDVRHLVNPGALQVEVVDRAEIVDEDRVLTLREGRDVVAVRV